MSISRKYPTKRSMNYSTALFRRIGSRRPLQLCNAKHVSHKESQRYGNAGETNASATVPDRTCLARDKYHWHECGHSPTLPPSMSRLRGLQPISDTLASLIAATAIESRGEEK